MKAAVLIIVLFANVTIVSAYADDRWDLTVSGDGVVVTSTYHSKAECEKIAAYFDRKMWTIECYHIDEESP